MQRLSKYVANPLRMSGIRRLLHRWPYLLLMPGSALLLCSSVFFFAGPKVDESEVVLNAVAIAAGSWSPEWPGYGHLAMYLPAALLSLLALLLELLGAARSYTDGIYLLFQNDAAYRITRFFYAMADVATALIFFRVIVATTGQRLVATLFFVYFLLSPDSWEYANYIRTDTLVSFFTAIAAYALVRRRTGLTPLVLGVTIGAAIACKYSALVYGMLVILLLVQDEERPRTWPARVTEVFVAGAVALLAAWLFQPRYNFGGIMSAASGHLAGSHFVQDAAPVGERLARLWQLITKAEPLAALWLMLLLPALLKWRKSIPLFMLVLAGILPSMVSHFPRDYWMLPFADALRAAGWLGVACIAQALIGRFHAGGRGLQAGLVVAVLAIAVFRLPSLQHTRLDPHRVTNADAALHWLYANVVNREKVIYVYEKNFLLPRAYSFNHYGSAKDFSRVFIFKRENFESLNELFKRRYFGKEFAQFSSIGQVRALWFRAIFKPAPGDVPLPTLCAGRQCFKPRQEPCDEATRRAMGDVCVNYIWDMDKPELRSDLSRIRLRIDPAVEMFSVCWYDCAPGALDRKVNFRDRGDIPLPRLAGRLFAPADVMPLSKVRQLPKGSGRVFIVTTPAAYQSWLKGAKLSSEESRRPREAFERLMSAKLVQRFDNGAGAVIEVYRR